MRRASHLTSFYFEGGKRLLDLGLAIPACMIIFPVFCVVALLVRKKLGSPVLFRQYRPGMHARIFRMYKFRTMTDAYTESGGLQPDSERLCRWGRFLRSTSLDELPELINVLKGDMSLVGPRPLLVQYLKRYSPRQARRHEVKPGLTGWAQVNGRNALCWEDKFQFDVWYVDHLCFMLDLKIIALTIMKVIRREGINHAGEATMAEFMGVK